MRYIEVNSEYRDRKTWPLSSEFEIPISQSGTLTGIRSADPICDAMPTFAWTANNYIIGGGASVGSPAIIDNTQPISYTSDSSVFIISSTFPFQQLDNYYSGAVITDTAAANNAYRRIFAYKYLGSTLVLGIPTHRAQISTFSQFSDGFAYGNSIIISDPSDFSDPRFPLLFIPAGPRQDNAFNAYLIYNETLNESRPIKSYDSTTCLIEIDTTGSSSSTSTKGPLTTAWLTTQNYSLRKQRPDIPTTTIINPVIVGATGDSITVSLTSEMSIESGKYRDFFVRFLPYGSSIAVGDISYQFEPRPSNDFQSRVTTYIPDTGSGTAIIGVYPPFETIPSVGTSIEIFPISRDNYNPFVYTGSLVSQQDMVCYTVRLSSLTIPNSVLIDGLGGRPAFYPYLYVELSNVSASGAGLKNIIYSNNPVTTSMIFRVQIYDVQDPLSTPFVRVSGDIMPQTIKFKPNDNLFFRVILPNGENIQTKLVEHYSPASPNPFNQVTALFSFERL